MNFIKLHKQNLKSYNSLRIDAIAENFFFPLNAIGVQEIYKKYRNSKVIILGKGSNILLSKKYYNKDYIFMSLKLLDEIKIKKPFISVESGATLSSFVWAALESNLKGMEFLEDIPGSIGGALVMNAGTYEDNISLLVSSVYYYDIEKNIFVTKNVNISDFDRRSSIFDNNKCIISCEFKLSSGDYNETLERLLKIKKERYLKQPRNYYNAGSVFKRPIHQNKEYYVWKLVEQCGLRGLSKNDAMISDKHTGFIVNKGNATYEDIKYLIDLIIETVFSKYEIKLELEWKIL